MNYITAFVIFASVALSASQVTVSLEANQASEPGVFTVENVFGPGISANDSLGLAVVQFFNGRNPASVTLGPATIQGSLAEAVSTVSVKTKYRNNTYYLAAGFTVEGDRPGSGVLSVNLNLYKWNYATSVVLLSVPSSNGNGNDKVEYVPQTLGAFNRTIIGRYQTWVNFPVVFGMTYAMISLNYTTMKGGFSPLTAWQASTNSTVGVAYNGYTSWSDGQSSSSLNINVGTGNLPIQGNPFVLLYSQSGNLMSMRISSSLIGTKTTYGTIAPPLGTNSNIGVQYQFRMNSKSYSFKGNITWNSNGKKMNLPSNLPANSYSWFTADYGNASPLGWSIVPSVSYLDSNGNLVVTSDYNTELPVSEWMVASKFSGSTSIVFSFGLLLSVLLFTF